MQKMLISILVLFGIIFISGCVEQDEDFVPVYKDEALKMEIEMAGEALPEQAINMKVHLTNQVEYKVENVEFRITDFYGLKLKNQICGSDGSSISSSECGFMTTKCGCKFNSIQSLDDEEMNFVFQLPSEEEIARIGRELEPEITLKYNYWGESTLLIPVLSFDEKSTSAKIESVQSKGPIHVDIERGFTSSSDPWEKSGSGFSIVVRVKDVVNSKNEMTIDKGSFTLDLTNLVVNEDIGRCDFDATGSHKLKQNISLPMKIPLVCALTAQSTGGVPWVYGQITAKYDNYEYKVVETKSIEVETIIV
jgi:hypothetical protein